MKQICLLMMVVIGTSTSAQIVMMSKQDEGNTEMMKNTLTTTSGADSQETIVVPVAVLIPFYQKGKFGYKNQNNKIEIPPNYSNISFFAEDCRILNSPDEKIREFGSAEFASVEQGGLDYRIDKTGKKVYLFSDKDLGKCPNTFQEQKYLVYNKNKSYGLIQRDQYEEEENLQTFLIEPQYDMIHVLEGQNLNKPLLVVAKGNKFGIIDIHNNTVVPLEYADIKRNFSWKLANLFEVTKDGKNYYYIDINNKAYK